MNYMMMSWAPRFSTSLSAAVGLAQNLAALRALATEGIQRGHMELHARNIAMSVGAVGEDWASAMVLRAMARDGVDISGVSACEGPLLRTLVMFDERGTRRLMALRLRGVALSPPELTRRAEELLEMAQLIYVGEVFVELAEEAARRAKDMGKMVVYRPGSPYARLGLKRLKSPLAHADIFILNEVSWRLLRARSPELEDPSELLDLGPEHVILTLGERGCVLYGPGRERYFEVPKALKEAYPAVDETGAGDAFSSGLIKAILEGRGLEEAIRYGQAAAAITCSRLGTYPSFPTAQEFEEALAGLHRDGLALGSCDAPRLGCVAFGRPGAANDHPQRLLLGA